MPGGIASTVARKASYCGDVCRRPFPSVILHPPPSRPQLQRHRGPVFGDVDALQSAAVPYRL
eukprot:CAMPEP_0182938256 /NCGR_PEP_ID=MMETSP0105_2-20130417/43553_1 /TAXON_ID=81532 ORGANISM="Acanthoeca-like sp., Strain 10tr" /NCGR_SAMPLE_ID=MMETSP0105_2 /ASSEMBLY_ACC=CAM_ASM_000205 /LENGTH=61 /DNA_ID=CAMNT_0025077543 /DNA_START=1144 /DNA_END=1329 /DNA_ORIENTATION=+